MRNISQPHEKHGTTKRRTSRRTTSRVAKEKGVYVKIYLLQSVDATRTVKRFGKFVKGAWVRVPEALFRDLKDAEGWKGKIERRRIK